MFRTWEFENKIAINSVKKSISEYGNTKDGGLDQDID